MLLSETCGKLIFILAFLVIYAKGYEFISDITVVKTLFPKDPTNPRIICMGRRLLEIQYNFNALGKIDRSSLNTTQNLVVIEGDLLGLRKKIYNQKTTNNYRKYNESVIILKNNYHILYGQMLQIKRKNYDLHGAIEAVKKYQFPEAEDILEFVGNSSFVVQKLVQQIYAENIYNVKILTDFARAISTIDLSLMLLLAINNEIKFFGDISLLQRVDLVRIMEIDVVNQTDFNPINFPDAASRRDSILASLKKDSTDMMESEMLRNTFKSNTIIASFLFELYSLNANLSNEILFETIDKVYGKISNREIIDNIYFQCSSPQKKNIFVYMYKKMKAHKELDSALLILAEHTFNILDIEYFKRGLEGNRDDALVTVWNEMPNNVRNLFYGNTVCLKEARNYEYLYAASDGFINSNQRRYVFTWIPRQAVSQGAWYVEHEPFSEDFYFVNWEHHNEYLYASEDGIGESHLYKYVFTWIPQGRVDSGKSAWNLETSGNYLRIRNVYNKYYLCVTSKTYSDDRRFVFTLVENMDASGKFCLWILEQCLQ